VLAGQCLDHRIESIEQLAAETAVWEHQRNAAGASIKWMFTPEKARGTDNCKLSEPIQLC
jgi:hypothetical protein